jgi:hypothetical protein
MISWARKQASKTELSHKTEKQTTNCSQTRTEEGVGGMLNLPQRKGVGQRTKLSAPNSQWTNTVTNHIPKQDRYWVIELISWTRGQHSKPNYLTSLEDELTKQQQLKDNTAVGWEKQQFWPSCMIWQTYLTSQFQLSWCTEEQNTTHKPVTWWDHSRASAVVFQYQDWMPEE